MISNPANSRPFLFSVSYDFIPNHNFEKKEI
jgi:hypothetical protein